MYCEDNIALLPSSSSSCTQRLYFIFLRINVIHVFVPTATSRAQMLSHGRENLGNIKRKIPGSTEGFFFSKHDRVRTEGKRICNEGYIYVKFQELIFGWRRLRLLVTSLYPVLYTFQRILYFLGLFYPGVIPAGGSTE